MGSVKASLRILLADDHAIVRAGVRLLLDRQRDMKVIAESGDGLDALSKAVATRPDVILLDLSMPRTDATDTIARLRRACPEAVVVVLTVYQDPAFVTSALAAGAHGYVVKTSPSRELVTAIRTARAGERYLDTAVRGAVQGQPAVRRAGRSILSPRETQVLRLLSLGHTNQQIATHLKLSTKTVETFRARVARKLALRDRAALVRYALSMGLVDMGEVAARPAEEGEEGKAAD
jgi:two-component system, NarL family, response regulator NreC